MEENGRRRWGSAGGYDQKRRCAWDDTKEGSWIWSWSIDRSQRGLVPSLAAEGFLALGKILGRHALAFPLCKAATLLPQSQPASPHAIPCREQWQVLNSELLSVMAISLGNHVLSKNEPLLVTSKTPTLAPTAPAARWEPTRPSTALLLWKTLTRPEARAICFVSERTSIRSKPTFDDVWCLDVVTTTLERWVESCEKVVEMCWNDTHTLL